MWLIIRIAVRVVLLAKCNVLMNVGRMENVLIVKLLVLIANIPMVNVPLVVRLAHIQVQRFLMLSEPMITLSMMLLLRVRLVNLLYPQNKAITHIVTQGANPAVWNVLMNVGQMDFVHIVPTVVLMYLLKMANVMLVIMFVTIQI